MKVYMILIIFFIVLTSCVAESSDDLIEPTEISVSSNPVEVTPTLTADGTTVPISPTTSPSQISSPAIPATPSIEPSATATISTPALSEEVRDECVRNPDDVGATKLTDGLILSGELQGEEGQIILANKGLQEPFFIHSSDDLSGLISPNGEWIAFFTFLDVIDGENDTYSIELTVTNFTNQEEYKIQYENITLSRLSRWRWVNNSWLIIPLQIRDNLFQWQAWNPFSNEQKILAIELNDIGGNLADSRNFPAMDPMLELVVYPCVQCSGAAYNIKELGTDYIIGNIHLVPYPSPFARNQAVWSPDGNYFAIVVGPSLSDDDGKLWIFSRNGEIFHEIHLPNVNGIVGGGILSWSPNSQLLAFYRVNPNLSGVRKPTLAYFDLNSGSVIDLCFVDIAEPVWSQDSSRIAFNKPTQNNNNNGDELVYEILIVDIYSDEAVQINTSAYYKVIGWTNIPSDS